MKKFSFLILVLTVGAFSTASASASCHQSYSDHLPFVGTSRINQEDFEAQNGLRPSSAQLISCIQAGRIACSDNATDEHAKFASECYAFCATLGNCQVSALTPLDENCHRTFFGADGLGWLCEYQGSQSVTCNCGDL